MPFDSSTITEITHEVVGGDFMIVWKSTSPDGVWYQVYVNSRLVDATREKYLFHPMPSGRASIAVGVVGSTETDLDFSSSLPAIPLTRAHLQWRGGRYLAEDISGFFVYSGATPGGDVQFSRPVATVPAFSNSVYLDGFGRGGFGRGGFGRAEQFYEWTSNSLSAGLWRFAIQSVDVHGNPCDTTSYVSVNIAAPPEPAARDSQGRRIRVTDVSVGQDVEATLEWLASPSQET